MKAFYGVMSIGMLSTQKGLTQQVTKQDATHPAVKMGGMLQGIKEEI